MTNKEAIEIINNRLNTYYCTDEDLQALDLAIKALENEPKKGEWITVNPEIRGYTDFFRCSTCLAIIQLGCLTKACDYIFCPYCGADMREADNE